MTSRWAPDNPEGLHAYLVISQSMWDAARGTDSRRIEYEVNLATAKRMHGWTRASYTTVKVRRAVPSDLDGVAAQPTARARTTLAPRAPCPVSPAVPRLMPVPCAER